jgi:hypothetical protein
MKKIALMLFITGLFYACKKDPEPEPVDLGYVIRGEVVDSLDQKPIAGIILYVNTFIYDGFNIKSVTEAASDTTDAEGRFEMKYTRKEGEVLKFRYIPLGYQPDFVFVNGNKVSLMNYHGPSGAFLGFGALEDDGYYKIELIPY